MDIPIEMKVRNSQYVPFLDKEGTFLFPMPSPPPVEDGKQWSDGLKPYERLFYHQTLSSVRGCRRFRPTPEIPKDSLDFQLQSRYDHGKEDFPEKVDMVLQRETCSKESDTFRILRNLETIKIIPKRYGQKLTIGGTTEKMSPDSVKLINSGVHNQLVNNGYSRQTADGNFFRY